MPGRDRFARLQPEASHRFLQTGPAVLRAVQEHRKRDGREAAQGDVPSFASWSLSMTG